jgi:hypothetical protein
VSLPGGEALEEEMQVFTRDRIETHCAGVEWPDFLGSVEPGERFVVETERSNRVNGPIAVEGIRAGDNISVHIESIEILPPFESPNGGPFFEGMGDPVPLEYRDGLFRYPDGTLLPARPSVGNVACCPLRPSQSSRCPGATSARRQRTTGAGAGGAS